MVSFSKVAALAVSLLLTGEALANKCLPKCKNPATRREWRTLSKQERLKYIDSVKCLMKKPALTDKKDLPGAKSRYDDFLGTHIVRADDVHFVGVFYPYHRLLVNTYEQELQKCGWKGGIPYWDWTLDTVDDEAFFSSPIFDDKTGFGGNGKYIGGNWSHPAEGLKPNTPWDVPGRTGGGCLETGPFAGLQSSLGPEANIQPNPHCVRRDFSAQALREMSGAAMVAEGEAQKDYGFFDQVTELSTHSGGHWGIGGLYGTMTDKWASPADPLFWLHHANVDRSWWSWQSKDLKSRVYDISGPIVPFDYGNQVAGNVTMDTPITIFETPKTQVKGKVWDVMHIQKGPLCYQYDDIY